MIDIQAVEDRVSSEIFTAVRHLVVPAMLPGTGEDMVMRLVQHVASSSPHVVYVYDMLRQHNVYANRELGELLGYSAAEARRVGAELIGSLIHPDDLPRMQAHIEHLAAVKDGETAEVIYRMRHATGSWCQLASREIVAARDADGAPTLIVGITQSVVGHAADGGGSATMMGASDTAQGAASSGPGAPIILLADGVIVLSLAASLGAGRWVIRALAGAVAATHARITILDITNVPVVDVQAATLLLQAAHAVRLLGARVVLTGARAETIQPLAELGADLGDIVTHSTLQSGIAYCLSKAHLRA